jgi:hypothetical protein
MNNSALTRTQILNKKNQNMERRIFNKIKGIFLSGKRVIPDYLLDILVYLRNQKMISPELTETLLDIKNKEIIKIYLKAYLASDTFKNKFNRRPNKKNDPKVITETNINDILRQLKGNNKNNNNNTNQ